MNFFNTYMNGYSTAANGAAQMGQVVAQNGNLLGYNINNNGMFNRMNNNPMLNTLRGGPATTHSDLQTPAAPVGIYGAFAQHQEAVRLHVREQSNSRHSEDYSIVDTSSGAVLFQVRGESRANLRSLTEKKHIYDRRGSLLYTIRRKGLSIMRGTFEGVEPQSGRVIFTVEGNVGRPNTLTVHFLNTANQGERLTLHLGEDMFHHAAKITLANGVPIAQVSRDQASYGQMLFTQQSYHVTVAPRVDTALVVAICICLDEKARLFNPWSDKDIEFVKRVCGSVAYTGGTEVCKAVFPRISVPEEVLAGTNACTKGQGVCIPVSGDQSRVFYWNAHLPLHQFANEITGSLVKSMKNAKGPMCNVFVENAAKVTDYIVHVDVMATNASNATALASVSSCSVPP